jgi:hypothetical protein
MIIERILNAGYEIWKVSIGFRSRGVSRRGQLLGSPLYVLFR